MTRLRNLLHHTAWQHSARFFRRMWPYTWPVLAGLAAIVLIFGALFGPRVRTIYREALAGKADLTKAQSYVVSQEFTEAFVLLKSGRAHLETAQTQTQKLGILRSFPWVKTQIHAAEELLAAGIATTSGVERLSTWAERVVKPFKTGKSFSLGSLKPEQKRAILKAIYEAQPDLQGAKASIDLAVTHLDAIPTSGLAGKLDAAVQPFRETLPSLQEGIAQAIPASKVIPPLLGYPSPQNYLFLLQNNAELRPTGGFIGTYGIVKVVDSNITTFTTDNVYNLDDQAKDLQVQPPAPLTRYNKTKRWLFRDSNWSPDFPTAAQEALSFYRLEGGTERNLNGVIAVDPTFFASLLEVTGPITIKKKEFRADNLVEELQYITGVEYTYQGLSTAERKQIIGTLGQALIEKMLKLPKEKYGKAWTVFQQNLEAKHILVWVADTNRQNVLADLGWSGAVQAPQGDALMVVDANIASLKSDPAVQRTHTYEVHKDGDDLIAELTLTYEHTGKLNWKTTRYRTYTRVLVPKGSVLLKSSGAMVDCNVKREGTVTTSETLGLAEFAAFTCTEVGATHSLKLTYKLGGGVGVRWDQGEYQLLVQKQPGTAAYTLNVKVDLGDDIVAGAGTEHETKISGHSLLANLPLATDLTFSAQRKP